MPLLDLSPGQVERLMSGLSYRKAFKKQLNREYHEEKKACLQSLMCYAGIVLCAMPNRVCIKATKQRNTTLHFMFYAIDGLVECQN